MSIAENNLIRFIGITKKKGSSNGGNLLAKFFVKSMKGGAVCSSTIVVDVEQANLDASYPLEQIIEGCGKIAVKMFETKLQLEGIQQI